MYRRPSSTLRHRQYENVTPRGRSGGFLTCGPWHLKRRVSFTIPAAATDTIYISAAAKNSRFIRCFVLTTAIGLFSAIEAAILTAASAVRVQH